MFRLIFRFNNEIYPWGNMTLELEPAKYLFTLPIASQLINVQLYFSGWYDWAWTQCRVQGLMHQVVKDNDAKIGQQNHSLLPCSCHQASPYDEQQLWSLYKAFIYGFHLFLDKSKSNTLAHWSYGLDSRSSSLPHACRQQMIKYAVYDLIAITYLIRPITERWSFTMIKNRRIDEIFISFQSTKLSPLPTPAQKKKKKKNTNVQSIAKILRSADPDIESISSDDEIYLNQLVEPVNVNCAPAINDDEPAKSKQLQQRQEPEPILELMEQELDEKEKLNDEQLLNDIELIINEKNQLGEINDNEDRKENPTKRKNRPHREPIQASKKRRNRKRRRRKMVFGSLFQE